MNAICLVIDRLHAGYMGAYGNAWMQTPQLDALAAESFLLDQAVIDSPALDDLYRSYWHGWHAIRRSHPAADRPSLPELLGEGGITGTLLTDEPDVARHPLAAGFDDLIEIEPSETLEPESSIERTHLARCFAQAIDWLQTPRGPFLLWCHLSGLGGPWDAPREFRRAYVEEGDPPPRETADVPSFRLKENYDPDELLSVTQAYAGQVSLLDSCVGAFVEFLREGYLQEDTLLVLLGARGFPLGEHLCVGTAGHSLYGELVQVPWLLRFPSGLGATARTQALVEPSDLWATLLDWCEVPEVPETPTARSLMPLVREEVDALRDRALVVTEGLEQAIRTPAWFLRESSDAEEGTVGVELFAKPDDRWEVNNVASRCYEVVERLREAFAQSERQLQEDQPGELEPLEDFLINGEE